jgi:DMSO/TMAO reductase YedYZ molybdopterin-dependent catalytic subunit
MSYIHPIRIGFMLAFVFACSAPAQTPPAAAAALTVQGDIPATVTLSADDLALMPHETVSVADQDGTKVIYEGVPLREVLKRAGAPSGKELRGKAMASYILAKAHDGYQVVFSLGEIDPAFGNESILVADKRDGKALFGYQGPLRLVCPNDKAGARSVRMLETLEVVRLQK